DLKVPIVAASNMIELFLSKKFGDISEKQEYALSNMKASNKELLNLVQILLDTYKISDKGIELSKDNLNLNPFITSIVEEMQPLAKAAGIQIKFEETKNDMTINADALQLHRVVKNLLNNAIDHSHTKKDIEVHLGEIPGYKTISIVDFGQGISKEEIPMIFNKYYSAAKKLRKVGTGLGLYLSQAITQAHGGEITVTSEENVRTEFCVKLPV
ncbi:HAMP domain-containing histidine kinase, partial [bacterium]|nr:HAMP domain-containing histidine kinase [bacterium]